jgi:hypothetical protein
VIFAWILRKTHIFSAHRRKLWNNAIMRRILLIFVVCLPLSGCATMKTSPWRTYKNDQVGFSLRYPSFVRDPDHRSCERWIPVRIVRGEARTLLIQDYDLTDLCDKETPTNAERAMLVPDHPEYRHPDIAIRMKPVQNDEEILEFARNIFGNGCAIAAVNPLSPMEMDVVLTTSGTGGVCRTESGTSMLRLNTASKYALALIARPPLFFDESGIPKGNEVLPSFKCFTPPPPKNP